MSARRADDETDGRAVGVDDPNRFGLHVRVVDLPPLSDSRRCRRRRRRRGEGERNTAFWRRRASSSRAAYSPRSPSRSFSFACEDRRPVRAIRCRCDETARRIGDVARQFERRRLADVERRGRGVVERVEQSRLGN